MCDSSYRPDIMLYKSTFFYSWSLLTSSTAILVQQIDYDSRMTMFATQNYWSNASHAIQSMPSEE